MKKKFNRVLCLLLCTIMMCTMMPMESSAAITQSGSRYSFTTFEDLKELAASTYDDFPYTYLDYESAEPLIITEDLTLPAGILVTVREQVVVPTGSTLTISEGSVLYVLDLTVEGKLIANGAVCIINQDNAKLVVSGIVENNCEIGLMPTAIMCIENGGAYTGSGYLYLRDRDVDVDFSDILCGLNIDDFESAYINGSWRLRDCSDLIRLKTPTDLKWGRNLEWKWNEETQVAEYVETEQPGIISWEVDGSDPGIPYFTVYKDDDSEPYMTDYSYSKIDNKYIDDSLWLDNLESGTYYFTVTMKPEYGYDGEYAMSKIAVSDTWTYIKPAEELGVCTNLTWNWPGFSWDTPVGLNDDDTREYYVLYASNENETPQMLFGGRGGSMNQGSVWDNIIQEYGDGYYYFKVRALSGDITTVCHGDWVLSEPYIFSSSDDELNNPSDEVITPEVKYGEFSFYENELAKVLDQKKYPMKYTYHYDDAWFLGDSSVYNHDLAQMSIRAALAGFNANTKEANGDNAYYIKALMEGEEGLGFVYDESSIHYPDPYKSTIGYAIGSKNISNDTTVLMVTVRGGGYEGEWYSNCIVGETGDHQGFDEASIQVRNGIKTYMRIKYQNILIS